MNDSSNTWHAKLKEVENTGDLYFEIPDDVMERLGWKTGDDLEFIQVDEQSYKLIKKQHDE